MGHVDYGGGPRRTQHGGGVSVADLTGPADGEPDVAVDLAAREESFALASGERVQGYTLNGTSPGPADRGAPGRPGAGDADQRRRARRGDAALARRRRARTPRTASRGSPRTPSAPGEQLRLPLRRRGRRHVLVPLPPGLARPGARRAVRHARRRCRPRPADAQDVVAPVHTYSGRRTVAGQHRRSRRVDAAPRAPLSACAWSTPTTARCATWVSGGAVPGGRRRRAGPQRARPTSTDEGVLVDRRRPGRPARHRARPGRRRRRHGARGRPARHRRSPPAPSPRGEVDLLSYGTPAPRCRSTREQADRSLRLPDRPPHRPDRRQARLLVDDQRQALPRRADVPRHRGRRRPDDHQQRQRRRPPDAPARPPRRRPVAQRRPVDRQPVVGRLAQRRRRRHVRDRLRRGQPGHLDGPLPQPRPRPRRAWSPTWPTPGSPSPTGSADRRTNEPE